MNRPAAPGSAGATPGPGGNGANGARQRRRGLYGPPPRLTATSPLSGRLVWHIGDWGRASEHIGARWEQVAGAQTGDHLEPGDRLLVLGAQPELMSAVLGSGLPHADALRTWREADRLGLEPLDFKWSLETASARQVSSETLDRLLEAELGPLQAALVSTRLALDLDPSASVVTYDGRFVAPMHPANRAALIAEPGLPTLLLPVDARAFFEPLPGWATAHALARLESSDLDRLSSLEAIERYYRLGAGVDGALSRLHTSLFETQLQRVDGPVLVDQLRAAGRARTLNGLLVHLQQELGHRKLLEERLQELPRTAYPFGKLRADLQRLNAPRSVLESRGALGRAYGEVTRELTTAIRAAGRELEAGGMSEQDALQQLGQEAPRWAALGAAQARTVAARLAGNS